jgi:hypothetical protein
VVRRITRKPKARFLSWLASKPLLGSGAMASDFEEPHLAGKLLSARDLEAQIEAFVDHYNHQRFYESLNNVTPSDVYFGRDKAILKQRERVKRKTLEARRLHHRQRAA